MNVDDMFRRLSFGELSNLALGQSGEGFITNKDQNKIVTYANAALIVLYSRFIHKRSFISIRLQNGVKRYQLNSAFAVSRTAAHPTKPHYVLDTVEEPFDDDVIKILCFDYENEDEVLKQEVMSSIRHLSIDTLLVKNPKDGVVIDIEYQARHPTLTLPADRSEQILLAPILWAALDAKIAASVYGSMNGEANMVKAQGLLAEYEQLCMLAKMDDLLQETTESDVDKLHKAGWL